MNETLKKSQMKPQRNFKWTLNDIPKKPTTTTTATKKVTNSTIKIDFKNCEETSVVSPTAATIFFRIFFEACCEAKRWKPCPDLALHQRFPRTSPGPALQPSPDPVEPDLALHQGFLEPSPELFPEPCWTSPGSAPKPPRPSLEPCPEPCWTWPGSAPKPPGTFSGTFSRTFSGTFSETFSGTPLNLTGCTEASQTFSGTPLNLTWLCTKASRNFLWNLFRNPV